MKNTGKIHKSLRKIPLGGNNVRRKPIRGLLFVFFCFPFILSAQLLTPDATQNIENYLNSYKTIEHVEFNIFKYSWFFKNINNYIPNENIAIIIV